MEKLDFNMGTLCCGASAADQTGHPPSSSKYKEIHQSYPLPNLSPEYRLITNRYSEKSSISETPFGLAGFQNLGNTCFINAVLQCIFNTQPLQDYFLAGIYESDIKQNGNNRGEYARALASLLTKQWFKASKHIKPNEFVNLVWQSSLLFHRGIPQDAHEFLAFILNKLHEDLNRASRNGKKPRITGKKRSERRAAKSWRSNLEKNCSIIIDLFQGQLKSTLQCMSCNGMKVKFEQFLHLSLQIPQNTNNPTLDDCLNEFIKPEQLNDKWFCPKCQTMVTATKKYDIWKVPPILIIHLKRFSFNNQKWGKSEGLVTYQLEGLDLGIYTASSQREPPIYEAFARIDHSGSLENGHYWAAVKNRTNMAWYAYDDSLVKPLDKDDLISPQAYVLFYQKTSITEYKRQQFDLPELWPHIVSVNINRRASEISDADISFMSNDSYVSNESYQHFFSDSSLGDSY